MALSENFLVHFCSIIDPRKDNHNKLHLLTDIIVLTILAVLCGAESFTEIEAFGKAKEEWLKTFLPLPHGIPSHDTLGNLFARLNPQALQASFLSWIKSVIKVSGGEIIPIDGKTLKRSYEGEGGRGAIHMVSAWGSQNEVVLGQIKTSEKSNEITAIPMLLGLLDIKGSTITIDAMGCQKDIAKTIVEKEADYVLALKGNQGTLHDDVQLFFEDLLAKKLKTIKYDEYETVEKGHGRIETRRYYVSEDIEWLTQEKEWKKLSSIGRVESLREIKGKVTREKRYYITSLPAKAEVFARAVRTHWAIENKLHWSLDVTFHEDDCRIRKNHAPENFAVIRHIALNLLKMEKTAKVGLKIKRSKAGWDNAYLMKMLTAAGF